MNRLQSELRRLYLPLDAVCPPGEDGVDAALLVDPAGATRALVLEVVRPTDWTPIDRAWRGAQSELGLPAPGIAVNGVDGFQLWFSLEAPVDAGVARAFVDALRRRFLGDLPADRVRSMPVPPEAGASPGAPRIPPAPMRPEQWSAFLAPDLARLFVDTPWLDVAPGADGQADLLVPLRSIDRAAFDAAAARLGVAASTSGAVARVGPEPAGGAGVASTADAPPTPSDEHQSPEAFLLRVMRDEAAPLALRVEAAKALLARSSERR